MKKKTTVRPNGTRRVQLDCSKPKLTDQSDAAAADINNIMKVYQKTGILPENKQKIAYYVDNTNIPSLEEAHSLIENAKEAFMGLPSAVRKLMDNDPTKLVGFIQNPENEDILLKYGILEKQEVVAQEVQPSPPAAAPVEPKA
jgi:hypothetical protein